MNAAYLKLWPEDISTDDMVVAFARAVANYRKLEKEIASLRYLVDPLPEPTLRNVVAQIMLSEGEDLIEKLRGDSIILDTPYKKKVAESFGEGYTAVALEVIAADNEMYRRKNGLERKKFMQRADFLWYRTYAEDDEQQLNARADMLAQEATGVRLVNSLLSNLGSDAFSFMGDNSRKRNLEKLFNEGTVTLASDAGYLYAHARYLQLVEMLHMRLPSVWLEYQGTRE